MKRLIAALSVAVLAFSMGAGCASLPLKQKIAVTLSASVDALADFQKTEENLYASKAIPGLTAHVHGQIADGIGKAAHGQVQAFDAMLAWRAGDPVPTTVTQTLLYAQQTYEVVAVMVPRLKGTTDKERLLVDKLQNWLDDLKTLAKAFNLSTPAWAQ